MHISIVTLPVNDIDQAVRFYTEKLGWKKTMDAPMGPGMRWVTIAPPDGQAEFTLSKGTDPGSPQKPGGFSGVIFHVDDVHKTVTAFAKKGVEVTDGPRDEPWGGWAMFEDSEGNIHGMRSPPKVK
ncbi:MAG: VOC family protein [Steroidobacteraceae bacterium]